MNIVNFNLQDRFGKPSPIKGTVGDALEITANLWATPTGTPTCAVYRKGSDLSVSLLSGSVSVSGKVVTLKKFTPNYAANYIYAVTFVIGNSTYVRKFMVEVTSAGAEQ